jgi:hypothetical protein
MKRLLWVTCLNGHAHDQLRTCNLFGRGSKGAVPAQSNQKLTLWKWDMCC